jgi:PAS domain S-box-containing protein
MDTAVDALTLERDRANAYLELSESVLVMLDANHRILEINVRGTELLGAPGVELLGRDWVSFLRGPEERERGLMLLQTALGASSSREREFDSMDAAGGARRIHWRCVARRAANGEPAGWLCSGQDVTERVRRGEEFVKVQHRLTRVARLATMGEMAAGIAHELNQPLTAISTYARACERFLDMPVPDFSELREAVREIGAEGLRAGEIIRRLRQMVRNGNEPAELRPTDVNALIEELRPLLDADAGVFDTQLDFTPTPQLPAVAADGVQIQQVVLNLVRNAFEAVSGLPSGKRRIRLSTVRDIGGDVEVRVSDNGTGIPPSIVGRLFEPFATAKGNGTGLGLAMSRTIVQSHRGTIGLRPDESGETTFFVRLPAAGIP